MMFQELIAKHFLLAILLLSVMSMVLGIVLVYLMALLIALFNISSALFEVLGGGYG